MHHHHLIIMSSHHIPPGKPLSFSLPLFLRRGLFQALLFLSFLTILFIFSQKVSPIHPRDFLGIGFFSGIIPSNNRKGRGRVVCDYSHGEWVWDKIFPSLKYTENCPFLDPGFRCRRSGRQDLGYLNWRWQPHGCDLPRLNASEAVEGIRNKRIVFSGDSLARNQWESVLCMLSTAVSNQSKIYEQNGKPISKHKGFLSMRFEEHNLTVEYYRTPFLVLTARPPRNAPKNVKGVIRVDALHWYSTKWIGADVLVFGPGHWWNDGKTRNSGIYFQEGKAVNMSMDPTEAFRRSLNTLKSWIHQNVNDQTSRIIFRSYSPQHYRDGEWNGGGHCDTNTAPETNLTKLEPEPPQNKYVSQLVHELNSTRKGVHFINITYMTEIRHDGHPSKHREAGTPVDAPQDCSHWCLPGVPDTWNQLLLSLIL